jgi:hypothetical protein
MLVSSSELWSPNSPICDSLFDFQGMVEQCAKQEGRFLKAFHHSEMDVCEESAGALMVLESNLS